VRGFMQDDDLNRKNDRLKLLRKLLDEEFGQYEEMPRTQGRQYRLKAEAAFAVKHPSGRPRVALAFSRELITDDDSPFESRFEEAIKVAKEHIDSGENTDIILDVQTDKIRRVNKKGG
jgi:hypothetical protein